MKKLFRRNALPAQQEINNVRFVKPNLKGSYALKENSPEFQSTCKPTRFPRSASCELAVVTAHDGQISYDVYEMHVRIRPREKKRRQLCRTSTKFVQEHENHCISRGCSFR